ncbi:MAG: hypothetical protein WCT06_02065 [Armatimonadota bacterium]|jgi:hypothetical protein
MTKFTISACAVLICLLCFATNAGAVAVANPSFEEPALPEGGSKIFIRDDKGLKWTVYGTVQVIGYCNAPDGKQALLVDASKKPCSNVYQVVRTPVGKRYKISFQLAPNLDNPSDLQLMWGLGGKTGTLKVVAVFKPEKYTGGGWKKLPWKKCEFITDVVPADHPPYNVVTFQAERGNSPLVDAITVEEYNG